MPRGSGGAKRPTPNKVSLAPQTVEEAQAGLLVTPPPPEKAKTETSRTKQHPPSPKIELLYFSDCPNYQDALSVLRDTLAAHSITTPVDLVLIETQAEAERQQFYGSPTIRIAGRDIVPASPNARPTLACRVYRTKDGAMTPMPSREVIRAALASHQYVR